MRTASATAGCSRRTGRRAVRELGPDWHPSPAELDDWPPLLAVLVLVGTVAAVVGAMAAVTWAAIDLW